jgi:DNA segregation ATPase FtsK/SpoIIIE, S-DNA-T family
LSTQPEPEQPRDVDPRGDLALTVESVDAETVDGLDEKVTDRAVDMPPPRKPVFAATISEPNPYRPIITTEWRLQNLRATLRHLGGRVAHTTAYHTVRLPLYTPIAAFWAIVGVFRLAGRQIAWWWVLEQHQLRQHAASTNDAHTWLLLHRQARQVRLFRGAVLLAELLALLAAATVLWLTAPLWAAVLVAVGLMPALARLGRPADRPIMSPAVIVPQYRRLTAELVRSALCALGLTAIKDPASIKFPAEIHRDGPGYLARVDLPPGVEAVDVLERRGKLSSALRLPVDQVWPSAGPDHAGQLDLWVGFLPASKMGQPTWSLTAPSARTTFFEPFDFATDERQRPLQAVLFQRNWLIGGVPGSGKSYGARCLAVGAALDPLVELKIAEFKGTADFGDLAHLCSTYACGVDDEAFAAGMGILTWGLREAARRGQRIADARARGDAPDGKVTPELARKPGSGLHPIVIVIDEAHELFGDAEVGKAAAQAAERLIKRGRALAITVILATQIPDKTSLPPNITRCVTVRWCMAVQDQVANDMILGTGAYRRGLTATAYRPGDDAGWGVATGISKSGPARSFFPDPATVAAVVARATMLRGGQVVGEDIPDGAVRADILADVLRVFAYVGRPKLQWEQLAAQLAEMLPGTYRGITADTVSGQVLALGGDDVSSVQIKADGINRRGCAREQIEAALARRELGDGG